jgi:hypothetical protein
MKQQKFDGYLTPGVAASGSTEEAVFFFVEGGRPGW